MCHTSEATDNAKAQNIIWSDVNVRNTYTKTLINRASKPYMTYTWTVSKLRRIKKISTIQQCVIQQKQKMAVCALNDRATENWSPVSKWKIQNTMNEIYTEHTRIQLSNACIYCVFANEGFVFHHLFILFSRSFDRKRKK